jgi:hypothetical protein
LLGATDEAADVAGAAAQASEEMRCAYADLLGEMEPRALRLGEAAMVFVLHLCESVEVRQI